MDDDGDELGDEGELGFPPGSFRPGRVVWAKVDGHEWWPAKVTPHCHHCMAPLFAAHCTRGFVFISCNCLTTAPFHPLLLCLWACPFQVTGGCCECTIMANGKGHTAYHLGHPLLHICIYLFIQLAPSHFTDISDAGCETEGSPKGGRPSPRRPCIGAHTDSSGLLHPGRGAWGGGRYGCQLTGPACCLHPSNEPPR